MGSKKAYTPLENVSGSMAIEVPEPRSWKPSGIRRSFNLGDLETLAPEFRYSIAVSRPDFGRYVGIVVEAYANREYMVVWTNQPLTYGTKKGMFNGDHLLLVENADKKLMGAK